MVLALVAIYVILDGRCSAAAAKSTAPIGVAVD
jgi:hypothetical protein